MPDDVARLAAVERLYVARCIIAKGVVSPYVSIMLASKRRPKKADQMEGVMMSRNETSQRYREAGEGVSERFGRASEQAATVARESSWNTIKGLQDYNEKVLEIAQTNVDAAFQFLRQVAVAKSAAEFITVATQHARRQYETSSEQAKELTMLAQRLAIASAEPVKEHATKMFDKAA